MFKNLFVFAFTKAFEHTQEQLEAALQEVLYYPCSSTQLSRFGWTSSLSNDSKELVHYGTGNLLICARREDKILPAQAIKDTVNSWVSIFEDEQGRSATKKEKVRIKEDVIFGMLPRAFSRITDTHAYISVENNIIVIDTSSRGKAEDLLALLRKSLGSLPVTSISTEQAPDETMTRWLVDRPIIPIFKVGSEAVLHSMGKDGAITRVKNQDLFSEEVKVHLEADEFVVNIALEFDQSMSFVLHDDLSIKKLKFFDVILEQNDDIDSEDPLARLDADFILISGEVNRLIYNLHKAFDVNAIEYLEK